MVKQDNKLGFLFLKEENIAHVIHMHEVVMASHGIQSTQKKYIIICKIIMLITNALK